MTSEANIRVLARQATLDEVGFRMEKLWRIFSWTSSVLVAIIGGTIALRTGNADLAPAHQWIIAASAIVLGLYAAMWLRQNLRLEGMARDALLAHDLALGTSEYNASIDGALPRPDAGVVVGYTLTVLMLAAGAIVAAVIPIA